MDVVGGESVRRRIKWGWAVKEKGGKGGGEENILYFRD